MTAWFADYAYLPSGLARDVRFEVRGGRYVSIEVGARPGSGPATAAPAERLSGVALPGFANAHSHAFHRALRGRTHDGGGTFWTWRSAMYHVAEKLDPDLYLALARATYAEMALAGVTAVGEFHYLHHGPDGVPYADPNQLGLTLIQAARDAGVRLTLLDTCYLSGGLGPAGPEPLNPVQRRFSDGDAQRWAARVAPLAATAAGQVRVGAAIHSVRAVPEDQLPVVAAWAAGSDAPLHVHVSEQPAENEASMAFYGRTPTALLAEAGVLGRRTTAVHATHLTRTDIDLLGGSATTACFCPTTERDLADGIGPARSLSDAGSPLSLGSDQHAVIDLIEESRALEMHERLATRQRGRFAPAALLDALTAHSSLGFPDAGRLAVGQRADLVMIGLESVRTAGIDPAQVLLAATAADVTDVFVDGQPVVRAGQHRLGDVGLLLAAAIRPLWAT